MNTRFPQTARFEVGKTYTAPSIGDSNCVFTFTVVKRTQHFITIDNAMFDEPRRVGLFFRDGHCECGGDCLREEAARPLGQYSMSPTIYAGELAAVVADRRAS